MLRIHTLNPTPYKENSNSEKKMDNTCLNPKKEEDPLTLKEAEPSKELVPPEDTAEEKLRPKPVQGEKDEVKPSREESKSDQEMLDTALEFCGASNDFWEQGDIENAIAALDEAYSLILKTNTEKNPDLLQQREDLRFSISKRIIEIYASRGTVVNGHNKEIPLVMNKHVDRALSLFKGKDQKFFLDAYHRSGRYRPFIVEKLKDAGLPIELSWIPLIESGFQLRVLSKARALGLWQFIASTGYKFGLERDKWIDERMDPKKSTIAAIAYLKELHDIFGDWTTAIAAYNCGEWRVLRCIKTQKINYLDNFWDLYEKLPSETAFYVPKFLAVLHILNDPEAHSFELGNVENEIELDTITINKQVSLKVLSNELGISYKHLWDMNPSLRHDYTPDRPFAFNVPKGMGIELLSKLGNIPAWHPPAPHYATYTVRSGDSLSVIARRYRTTVHAIMKTNQVKNRNMIQANQRLKIPLGNNKPSIQKKERLRTVSNKKTLQYEVKKGDSLWKIASHFGTTVNAIRVLNNLNNKHLMIGQLLVIPDKFSPLENIKTFKYKVLKGDSMWKIAQKHQMSLSEFLSLNDLTPRSPIFPGQIVLVKY
ncbi:MAG: LysM peptidoglycan-binding domain-containing protein [Deltaproteobacteria bacterium]|nr:LysM peptidoglycan-binding domain-containing protein [Deltaproteobacteria bacterium]